MSLHYILDDDAYSEVSQNLRDIKAISGVLSTAASLGDVEGGELSTLAFLILNKTQKIQDLIEVEPQKA